MCSFSRYSVLSASGRWKKLCGWANTVWSCTSPPLTTITDARAVPPDPPNTLLQAGRRTRHANQHADIQVRDINAQLQRAGRNHPIQRALAQPFLDLAPVVVFVPGAVRQHVQALQYAGHLAFRVGFLRLQLPPYRLLAPPAPRRSGGAGAALSSSRRRFFFLSLAVAQQPVEDRGNQLNLLAAVDKGDKARVRWWVRNSNRCTTSSRKRSAPAGPPGIPPAGSAVRYRLPDRSG